MKYEPEFDGLRAVAVVLVMAGHARLIGFADGGLVGVTIFFVLSGYLITGVLIADGARKITQLGPFYARRAARLLPAVAILLTAVSVVALATGAWSQVATGVLSAALYVANFADASGANMGPLEHTWSLATEEQFYFIWPALLLLIGRSRRLVTLVVVAIAAIALTRAVSAADDRTLWSIFHLPITRADALLVGCAAQLLRIGRPQRTLGLLAMSFLTLIVVAGLAPATTIRYLLLPVALAALVILLARPTILARRPLVAIGRISYGLYLWHYPLAVAFGPIGILAAIPVAAASFVLVEHPLRDAVRRRLLGSPLQPMAPRGPGPAEGANQPARIGD
jgi:peptidoglycan/LPS O-acetylase OafA/YrhL